MSKIEAIEDGNLIELSPDEQFNEFIHSVEAIIRPHADVQTAPNLRVIAASIRSRVLELEATDKTEQTLDEYDEWQKNLFDEHPWLEKDIPQTRGINVFMAIALLAQQKKILRHDGGTSWTGERRG